jgi:hypothetical protein
MITNFLQSPYLAVHLAMDSPGFADPPDNLQAPGHTVQELEDKRSRLQAAEIREGEDKRNHQGVEGMVTLQGVEDKGNYRGTERSQGEEDMGNLLEGEGRAMH